MLPHFCIYRIELFFDNPWTYCTPYRSVYAVAYSQDLEWVDTGELGGGVEIHVSRNMANTVTQTCSNFQYDAMSPTPSGADRERI